MAQWAGQYSGRTHATAIAGATALLVRAIAAYAIADDATRTQRARDAIRLAGRLLTTRRRWLKARAEDDAALGGDTSVADELRRLEHGGVAAVLAEHGAPESLLVQAPRRRSLK